MFQGIPGDAVMLILKFCFVCLLVINWIFGLLYLAGPGTERMDHKQSGSGNENSYSVGRQNWNVQFKDATSAAQAAAESAELASMAARAAAELSRQYSSESQKSYGYVQKDEEPQIYADSKLQSDHIAKQAENNAFHGRSSGLHDKNIVDNEREELSGAAERFHREGYKKNDGYNNAASLKSSSVSTDDDATLVNSFQTVDRYPQRKSSESDKRDLLDEVNKKKHSGEFELPSEEIAYFDKNVTSKQSKGVSSHSHSSCFSDDKEDVLRKDDNISYFEDTKTQKQSSGPSAQSHLSTFSDIHEDILKRNDPSENLFVDNDRSIYRKVSEINSSDNTALFDDYGSDDGNYNFDVGDYKEQETSFSFSSPSRNSSKNLFADSTVWSPRRNTDEGLTKSTSQLHLPVYPESSKGTRFPSRQEDLPPAAFDDYDSPSSDGEEVLGKSKLHGSADFDKFPSEKNLSAEFDKSPYEKNLRADFDKSPSEKDLNLNSPEPMQSEDHILGSSSSDAGNVGSRRNPWVPTTSVDPQPKEVHPDRSQGITSSSVSEKKFDYAEPGQLPPRFMKSVKDTPDFLDTTKDTELLEESTFESSPELKFGTLTGGLRNKGSRRPPYFRKSSQNSLSVEQETKDTFTNIEQSSSSPTMRTAIGSGAGSQEPDIEKENANLNSKIDRRTFVNFHDDDLEEELPQETSSSRQPYNQRLGIELNKKSNSRASHTYFDLDNSDSEEELPKLTSSRNARLGAGFSRRTKGSSSNSGRSYSKTTVLSGESRTPEYGADSNSSSSSSHAGEILPKPLSETKSSDHSVEEHTPQPIPESRRSSRMESLKSSTGEQKSNPHPASIEQDIPKSMPESRRPSRMETQKSPTRERTSSSLRFSVKQDWILPKPLSETKSSDHSVEEHTPQPIPESRRSSRMESLKSSTGEQKSNPHPASIEQDIPKSMPESRRPSRMETQKSPTRERTSSSLRSSVKQDTPNATPESRRSSRMENQKSPTREQTSSSLRLSAKQDTPEPILESRRSSPKESLKLSTREQTSKSLPKVVTSGVTEASKSPVGTPDTASKDKTTHVHPKLPDSDAFTAFFHSLRQTRE